MVCWVPACNRIAMPCAPRCGSRQASHQRAPCIKARRSRRSCRFRRTQMAAERTRARSGRRSGRAVRLAAVPRCDASSPATSRIRGVVDSSSQTAARRSPATNAMSDSRCFINRHDDFHCCSRASRQGRTCSAQSRAWGMRFRGTPCNRPVRGDCRGGSCRSCCSGGRCRSRRRPEIRGASRARKPVSAATDRNS